mmetsp:Transcript_45857/g.110378  ORF Transcript_45857/g.110378 Transcript_45857/m.110378 type:complete len:293 (+) Transcript_45857:71-949(+)
MHTRPRKVTAAPQEAPAPMSAGRGDEERIIQVILPRKKGGDKHSCAGGLEAIHGGATAKAQQPIALSRALLSSLFHLPLSEASYRLGLSATSIKKVCRKIGIAKWPYKSKRRAPAASSPGSVTSSGSADDFATAAPASTPSSAPHWFTSDESSHGPDQASGSLDTLPHQEEQEEEEEEEALALEDDGDNDGREQQDIPDLWFEAPRDFGYSHPQAPFLVPRAEHSYHPSQLEHHVVVGAGCAPTCFDSKMAWAAASEEGGLYDPSGWKLSGSMAGGWGRCGMGEVQCEDCTS